MKKTFLIFALALVLALSFSTIAMAKYAGYAYNTPLPGGGEWVYDDELEENVWVVSPDVANTSVGYLSWAGAQAIMTTNGVDAALQNTPHGGYAANTTKCAVCHSVHRATSDATVAGIGTYTKLTPGAQACIACHTAWGANPIPTALVEWGATADGGGGPHSSFQCLGACHAGVHGGATSQYAAVQMWNLTNRNDAAIAAAFAAGNEYTAQDSLDNDAVNRGRGVVTENSFQTYTLPAGAQGTTTARAMRAMATGYTCGASGCHSSSQFAVNTRGYAEARAGDPSNGTDLNVLLTGHVTNITYGCPPCHMNDIAFDDTYGMNEVGMESGCALCHDAIGKATGSTAFPHGNRNITFLETEDGLSWSDRPVGADSKNLWMYAGDATRRDATGAPSQTGNANNARKRTLIEYAAGFDAAGNGLPGNINDGTCLKCHAYKYGAHNPGGWPGVTPYLKADGQPTGNVLQFSKF